MTKPYPHIGAPVIILSAGLSLRMGQWKALLPYKNGKTFLEKIILEYVHFGTAGIILVVNKMLKNEMIISPLLMDKVRLIINPKPEKGRWSSLWLGLNALDHKNSCYIQNVDNPFVSTDLLQDLEAKIMKDNYVVPVFKGKGGHPVLLGQEIMKYILSLDEADRDLRELLNKFRRTEVETNDKNILMNINSMEEYRKYFKH
ncbi:MAG: NTP transferase domain-containing protein [Bacteroidales bacterium]